MRPQQGVQAPFLPAGQMLGTRKHKEWTPAFAGVTTFRWNDAEMSVDLKGSKLRFC